LNIKLKKINDQFRVKLIFKRIVVEFPYKLD